MSDKDQALYDAMTTMATLLAWLSPMLYQPQLATLHDQIETFRLLSEGGGDE
jgi:hypothetical protein